jgi:hypothetical protein
MDPGFRRDDDKRKLAVFSSTAVRAGALVAGTTPAIDIPAFAADRFT